MKTNWDLTVFYKDFDDPEFKDDLARLPKEIDAFTAAIAAPAEDEVKKLVSLVHQEEALSNLFERLSLMIELTLSVDANNKAANAAMAPLMRAVMGSSLASNAFSRYLASLENLDAIIDADDELKARAFALREAAEDAKHQLPEALEKPVLKMQLSGGEAFSQLRDKLDATLLVDYDGKQIPLSAVRALAYDGDADTRRRAYEAELASYKKIELPMSFCLNNINNRLGYDLFFILIYCLSVSRRNQVISCSFIEYLLAIHLLDHLAGNLTFTETRNTDLALFFLISLLNCLLKLFSRCLYCKLSHISF